MKRVILRPALCFLLLILVLWVSGCDTTGGQTETALRPAPTAARVLNPALLLFRPRDSGSVLCIQRRPRRLRGWLVAI